MTADGSSKQRVQPGETAESWSSVIYVHDLNRICVYCQHDDVISTSTVIRACLTHDERNSDVMYSITANAFKAQIHDVIRTRTNYIQ